VEKACRHLQDYLNYSDSDLAIACSLLRNAAREIGFMTGKVSAEHILDVIFADFCIGK
jgi:tRNA modification GTPase